MYIPRESLNLVKSYVTKKKVVVIYGPRRVTKTSRYYFWDNGIRNALINNFNSFQRRDDIGILWENYLVIEKLKKQEYLELFSNNYFWRTYDQKELDLVEGEEGKTFLVMSLNEIKLFQNHQNYG